MKVELHLHTTRYSACAAAGPDDMLARLVELGYQACFLTEHDEVWPDRALAKLRERHDRLLILPGVELTVATCDAFCHLLVLGTNDRAFLAMQDAREIIARADDAGCITVLAHPFRWEGAAGILEGRPLPDAIEHRTPNHDAACGQIALGTAESLGVAAVNSGDAHGLGFLGRFWIETDRPFTQPAELREIIRQGAYANRSAEESPVLE